MTAEDQTAWARTPSCRPPSSPSSTSPDQQLPPGPGDVQLTCECCSGPRDRTFPSTL